jgi:hypothetical protein
MAALPLGCGGGQPTGEWQTTVRAAGVLTHQGQPLAHYQVNFVPEPPARAAMGVTNETGEFTLGTNKPGDGAPAGKHQVSVVYVGPPGSGGDGMNDFSPPPPPKEKLPKKYGRTETSEITVEIPPAGSRELKVELP